MRWKRGVGDNLNAAQIHKARARAHPVACLFRQSELFLRADPDLHKSPWRLRAYRYLMEFCPVSRFADSHQGAGSDFSQGEAPHHSYTVLGQFHFGLEITAVVVSPHAVGSRLIVERDQAQGLKRGFSIHRVASNSLDHQDQSVELEFCLFRLNQFQRLASSAKNPCLSRPFSDQEAELPHRGALRFRVWHAWQLSHESKEENTVRE